MFLMIFLTEYCVGVKYPLERHKLFQFDVPTRRPYVSLLLGTFISKLNQSYLFSSRNDSTLSWFISCRASFSSFRVLVRFMPWSDLNSRTGPRLAGKRRNAFMNESVSKDFAFLYMYGL